LNFEFGGKKEEFWGKANRDREGAQEGSESGGRRKETDCAAETALRESKAAEGEQTDPRHRAGCVCVLALDRGERREAARRGSMRSAEPGPFERDKKRKKVVEKAWGTSSRLYFMK